MLAGRDLFFQTFGAVSMSYLSFGMITDIYINMLPLPVIITYHIAGSADRQQPCRKRVETARVAGLASVERTFCPL